MQYNKFVDNIAVVNEVCKLVGIDRKNPDNTDLEDENVWKSIRDDTTCIFQWESDSASAYLKQFMSDSTLAKVRQYNDNFSMIKWFSFGNGLIRPACASYRDEVANGIFYDNGLKELNDFLAPTMGHVTMQEDIMQFLVKFCGYNMAESDNVRRGIAKKKGTEQLIPEIKARFIEYTSEHYNVPKEKCEKIIEPFIQVILDASSYAFSWNHSDSYSCLGYILGWLRYYYPLEFFTVNLNINVGNMAKTNKIISVLPKYGISVKNIQFGKSSADYTMDKSTNSIYKGIASIKNCNAKIAEELMELSHNNYSNFFELLADIKAKTSVNSKQREILIGLNFFSQFGENQYLLNLAEIYDKFSTCKIIKKSKLEELGLTETLMLKYSAKETASQYSGINNMGLIQALASKVPHKSMGIINQVKFEKEYLNYVTYANPDINEEYYIITDYEERKTIGKPRLTLHNLATGNEINTKVKRAKYFKENPFGLYSVIRTKGCDYEFKVRPDADGKWVEINETEPILNHWEVIKK